MDTWQLHLISKHQLHTYKAHKAHEASDTSNLRMTVAGVLRHAQEGELPLFAWTLGLPQQDLLNMLASCFPELGLAESQALTTLPVGQYLTLMQTAPAEFMPLKQLLLDHLSPSVDAQHGHWLACAIAAASFGSRHLWQDLGLPGREAVSALMRDYFTALFLANTQNLKWKRFLFAELGRRQGKHDLRPPKCTHCDDFHVCFQDSATTA
ncbi:nitrogen fixation protein NifQ [Undibacterium sp. JH2W]|uniref:nitrogen fixation protein NifQ n=1 Tax=Undibacterium sp. JH2W TaxID=3413037 RepID=UPI003BF43B99